MTIVVEPKSLEGGMTLEQLREEVEMRGYDYVEENNPGRIALFLNQAYRSICARKPWPFLEEEVEVEGPEEELEDLRHITSVTNLSNEEFVRGVNFQYIKERNPSQVESGTTIFWYLLNQNEINFWPRSTETFQVRYIRRASKLEEADEPLIPAEWQYLMVDWAILYCLKDNDEYAEARTLKQDLAENLQEMVHDLLHPDYQRPNFIRRTGFPIDYMGY